MSSPLRIVHIVRSPIGGIFRHISDLARAQSAKGHEVGVICDDNTGGDFEAKAIEELTPYLKLGVKRFSMRRNLSYSDLKATGAIFKHIWNLKPDVLHGHGAKGGAYARMVGAGMRLFRKNVSRVYCPHGGSLHFSPKGLEGKIYFGLEWAQQFFTDSLIFVSDYEYSAYEAKVGRPRIPARIVYNGLNADEFEKITPADDPVDFLFIGMLRDLKGPDLFIKALQELSTHHKLEATAIIAGDGDDRPRYEAMVHEFGLADRVRFIGNQPARATFRKARCVVVPSRAEAMPYIVLETVAASIPLIATRVGGIPEIFGRYADRLVEPANVEMLANAMAHAMNNKEEVSLFSQNLRHCLAETFNVELMSDRITSLYHQIREAPDPTKLEWNVAGNHSNRFSPSSLAHTRNTARLTEKSE